ncbi:MAG: DUF4105 domain-containing protein [Myxococcota bacterium]
MIVPGTAWEVEGEWPAVEIAVLADAPVPPAWRELPVTVARGATHRPRRGRVELAEVTTEAWIHALAHVWDDETGASRRGDWRRIAGWSRAGRDPLAEHDPLTFAAPSGMEGPAEDLATVAAAWLAGEGDPCAWPSKARWMAERFGGELACPTVEDVGLDPANVESIEIVYVVASPSGAASLAGHVLVAVRQRPDARGVARADAWGIVADTTGVDDDSLRYAWYGLTGGFLSRVVWEPYEVTVRRYADGEDRDVRRYRLVLDEAQTRRALARLDELRQGWRRPYYFLHRNCVQLPVELLRAALGEGFRPPSPLSPDVLMAMLARRGLVAAIPLERPQEAAMGERALAAERLRRAHVRDPALRDRDPAVRAEAYGSLALAPDVAARVLGWSDPIERRAPAPAVDALRAARADLRASAGSPLPTGEDELVDALQWDRPGSDHTPFRRNTALGGWDSANGAWVGVRGALYESRLGLARRFKLSEGMEVSLLRTSFAISEGGTMGRSALGSLRHLPARPGPWRLGWGWTVADVRWDTAGLDARVIEGGGLVALWPDPRGGDYVAAGLGVSLDAALPVEVGAGVPVTLELQLASRRDALTALRAKGRWEPAWTGALVVREEAEVEAGLRLGSLWGADVGLVVRGEERREVGEPPRFTAGAGLAVERF